MDNTLEVKIKRLHPDAVIPKRGTAGSAGLDLTAISKEVVLSDFHNTRIVYSTGIALSIPETHVGLIFPRSSIYKKDMRLSNCVGVIDADFRGEIKFIFDCPMYPYRENENLQLYEIGERIGQLVIMKYPTIDLVEVEDLDDTERGINGFGSTDINNLSGAW